MHILIVRNNSNAKTIDASLLLATYLGSQNINYTMVDSIELENQAVDTVIPDSDASRFDLAVVLGGDGAILRTARYICYTGVPILGINFGHLGFLANPNDDGVVPIVAAALAGDVVEEHRTNLCVDVACHGDDLENFPSCILSGTESAGITVDNGFEREKRRSFFALNELAVTRGALGKLIDFSLTVAGVPVADMRGDGLVIATATGSTAYALSAGGPLIAPGYNGLVVVPLAPHTLHSRAIVTSPEDVVEVDLTNNLATKEATLFVDGELIQLNQMPAKVFVRRGEVPTTLLRYKHDGFYQNVSKVFFDVKEGNGTC